MVEFVKSKSPLKFAEAPSVAPSAAEVQPAASAPGTVSVTQASQAEPAEMDEIQKKIIKIVEEKTGYPEDLIEFDLDMESDLGIDTVKQAEMFGMIRETFQIPSDESIKIKDFPTLNHVVEFVKSKSPKYSSGGKQEVATEKPVFQESPKTETEKSNIKRMTLEMVEEDLGKDAEPRFNVKGYNVLITDDGRGVAKSLEKTLKESEANVEILSLQEMENLDSLTKAVDRVKKIGKINGLIHLTSIEESKPVDDMSFEDWRTNVFKRIKSLFFIAKTFQQDITDNAKAGNAFVASVTDMGGTFGIEDFKANNPIGGGVNGLTKALNKEFNKENNGVLVKAIDLEFKGKPGTLAKTIWNELQSGGSRVEVGYSGKTRMVPQVISKDLMTDIEPRSLVGEGSVFVVTGGGYGITSAISKDIAKNLKAKLAIISLESLPSNVKELASLDENGLKDLRNKVISELKSKNERVTPVMIDKEFSKYTIAIDIYNNLEEMKKLGSPDVEYYSCNVLDHKAMTETINKIRERFGSIDAIIHGAGIEQSRLMEDKSFEDFSRVVDVKADGCFNLVENTKQDGVKVLVTFASIAGRFGNIGQTDYSAANDLLNKYVQHSNRRFSPAMKAVSMNWSGWKGVGMATRGSITKIFEEANIDMIPMEEGVTKVREEILFGDDNEVIVAGSVGYIDIDQLIVGYKTKEFTALENLVKSNRNKYPLIDSIDSYIPGRKIVARKKLDTEIDLYLTDHAVEDVPYLPAVMGIESFAEASSLLFRDKQIKIMKDISFAIPVKILKGKPVNLIVTAEKIDALNDEIILKTRLESEFFNKDGVKLGDNKLHFEGVVVLGDKPDKDKLKASELKSGVLEKIKTDGKIEIDEKEIYKRFFHGPKYQVHGGVVKIGDNSVFGIALPNNGKGGKHFSFTDKPDFITNPMAIEAAFQNAGLFTMVKKDKMSLPDGIKELVFTHIPDNAKDFFVSAKYKGSDELRHEYDTEVVGSNGEVYSVMKGYKMIDTGDLTDNEKF